MAQVKETKTDELQQEQQSVQEIMEKVDVEARMRHYIGPMARIVSIITIVWSLFQIYVSSFGIMDALKQRAWFLGFLLVLIFLLFPAVKKENRTRKLPTIWDFICIVASISSVAYLLVTYDTFALERGGLHVPLDLTFGAIGIIMTFEAARRVAGPTLTTLAALFLLYNFAGKYIPGIFGHSGYSYERVVDMMFWGSQGIFGSVIGVASSYIFLFVLFGAFLRTSGFIDFTNNLALTVAGRASGGPAKVAVIGSGMMGMINGSGVANAVTVGTVTIPLMKKAGYTPRFAAAVEAVSGTGGLIAPPVMGAASFVMAEFLGVSYATIATAAIIPAILYYLTCFMSVHFEAKKLGLKGLPKEQIPNPWHVFKRGGHLIVPVIVLVGLMAYGVTPLFAAVWALISTVIVSWFGKENRMGLKEILYAMEEGARGVLTVGVACAIVGVIVGTISLTSLGLTVGNNILQFAGNHLFLIALFTALISTLLGMGVPATASYIITATLSAPLLAKVGVPLLSAHMFAFFFAALSDITPPVALAAYAAAGIAGAPAFKVGLTACRLGVTGFLIPFFFLYNPELLVGQGGGWLSLWALATAAIGVVALAAGLSNWFLKKPNLIQRLLLLVTAFLMINPGFASSAVGIVLLAVIVLWQKSSISKSKGKLVDPLST